MNKQIMLSVRPEWVEKILNGTKQYEFRTRLPKDLKAGMVVNVYCTKGNYKTSLYDIRDSLFEGDYYLGDFTEDDKPYVYNKYVKPLNGKAVASFVVGKIIELPITEHFKNVSDTGEGSNPRIKIRIRTGYVYDNIEGSCLTDDELIEYGKGKPLFAIEITDLKAFPKPREKESYYVECKYEDKNVIYAYQDDYKDHFYKPINFNVQSFCYCIDPMED